MPAPLQLAYKELLSTSLKGTKWGGLAPRTTRLDVMGRCRANKLPLLLWAKQSCAALRGSDSDVEAHAASATTCPDYRPLGSGCEFKAAYLINEEMYEFEGLGYEGGYGGYGENHICSNSLERADSVLEGRSNLAVVTAVHPTDRFVVSSTTWRAPRKFFVQARSEETGAHFRLGKSKHSSGMAGEQAREAEAVEIPTHG